MKKKTAHIIYLLIVWLTIVACVPDEPAHPEKKKQSRLWRKCNYNSVLDTISNCCDYYLYDSLNRIGKILSCIKSLNDTTQPNGFFILKYNRENELQAKLRFDYEPNKLYDSTSYIYENGLLIREECYNFNSKSSFSYTFEYNNRVLVRRCYTKNLSRKWHLYKYLDSLCFEELESMDSIGTRILFYTLHYYNYGIKIRSELFSGDNNSLGQIINYTYNSDDQLVLEEAITNPDWVAPGDHVYRYDYEIIP